MYITDDWNPSWWEQAECAKPGVDPGVFANPKRGRPPHALNPDAYDPWSKARKICRVCPVWKTCLRDTLNSEPTGDAGQYEMFQGGLSPNELTAARRRMRRAASR